MMATTELLTCELLGRN